MLSEQPKILRSLLCCCLALTSVVDAFEQGPEGPTALQIRLRPTTEVTDLNVRLPDIATFFQNDRICTLSDLPIDWQRQLRRVVVVRLSKQRQQAVLYRHSVAIRMGNLEEAVGQFELIGPEVASVSLVKRHPQTIAKSPFQLISSSNVIEGSNFKTNLISESKISELNDLSIERAIRDELSDQFGVDRDRLQVTLLRSVIGASSKKLKDILNPVIQVTVPVKMPYGRQSMLVRVLDGQQIAMSQLVTIDVRLRQSLLIARRPVSAGTKIDASMLTEEVRLIDRHYDRLLIDDVVGMTAIRPLQSQEIIAWSNLRDPSSVPASLTKPIINVRDAVKVVASHKALRIAVSAAEAMESGRKGQLIRVRNIQSRKIFSARVVRAGEVQLIL